MRTSLLDPIVYTRANHFGCFQYYSYFRLYVFGIIYAHYTEISIAIIYSIRRWIL